jgi:eukaryotic-like serine/threonine-protein kinase
MDNHGSIPPVRAIAIAAQTARAIDAVHDGGRFHGPIRPETVMIRADGHVSIDGSELSAETTTRSTYELEAVTSDVVVYFSPEHAQGLEVDQRSHLYSLGVVLFEMLTESVPFQSSSPMTIAYEHSSVPPPRVDAADPEIPFLLADIVDKALAKDPDDRYQSGEEMGHALDAALGEVALADAPVYSVLVHEDGASLGVSSITTRWHRWAMAFVVLLLGAVSAAGVLPMLRTSDDPNRIQAGVGDISETPERPGGRGGPGEWALRPSPGPRDTDPTRATPPPSRSPTDPSPTTTPSFATTAPTTRTEPTNTAAPSPTTTAPSSSTTETSTVTTQPATTTMAPTTTIAHSTTTTTMPSTSTSESSTATTEPSSP